MTGVQTCALPISDRQAEEKAYPAKEIVDFEVETALLNKALSRDTRGIPASYSTVRPGGARKEGAGPDTLGKSALLYELNYGDMPEGTMGLGLTMDDVERMIGG